MMRGKLIKTKSILVFFLLLIFSFFKLSAQDGKALFQGNCASCHSPFTKFTGPALKGLEERGPWSDRKNLYAWVHNPAGFMANDKYTQNLKQEMGGTMMSPFPQLSEKQIDAIVDYINKVQPPNTNPPPGPGGETENKNWVIFGII